MIQPKKKICRKCGKETYIWSAGKCKYCYYSEKENKAKIIIKPRSEKRGKENVEYLKLRLEFLNKHPRCQASLFNCSHYSTEIHHKRGKIGKLFLDILHWLATCRSCHRWIEENPKKAKELGLSENRL